MVYVRITSIMLGKIVLCVIFYLNGVDLVWLGKAVLVYKLLLHLCIYMYYLALRMIDFVLQFFVSCPLIFVAIK